MWHKERKAHGLGRPLGRLMALAVAGLFGAAPVDLGSRVLLIPAPSRTVAVRARGHDPLKAICQWAAMLLRESGWRVQYVPLLRLRLDIADQSGLDSRQRMTNLAESMTVRRGHYSALVRAGESVTCVVCDDILTTGATVRECQRALQDLGLPVHGVATIAHTVKRGPEYSASRLPFSSEGD